MLGCDGEGEEAHMEMFIRKSVFYRHFAADHTPIFDTNEYALRLISAHIASETFKFMQIFEA